MKIQVTGDYRDVANSAWISTMDEIRAESRTDDEAKRVVGFLVEHHHTSPFESITISFLGKKSDDLSSEDSMDEMTLLRYAECIYARQHSSSDSYGLTIDLLNFTKITMQYGLFSGIPWRLFAEARPELSGMCSLFQPLGCKNFANTDVAGLLGNHDMTVELVSFHDFMEDSLSRATWRVRCPLSIAVQILRHRAGSYNMVSGRYKTIKQEMVGPMKDCDEIFRKADIDLLEFLNKTLEADSEYRLAMKKAKIAKDSGSITNKEYKRLREFARFVLPEGRMTELYITYYLDDFYNNYLLLRDSEHAQTEHIWIAQEMRRVLGHRSR